MDSYKVGDQTDQEIIEKVLAGATADFQQIISKYKNMIFGLVFRSIRDQDDAEDLVQEIFCRLFDNLRKYNLRQKFHTWLYTVAINVIRNHLKRHKRKDQLFVTSGTGNDHDIDTYGKDDDRGTEAVLSEEVEVYVKNVLTGMKDKYRIVLVMFYFEGLTVREVAEILGMPQNSVKTRLKRAREQALEIIKSSKKSETFFKEICTF